MLRSGQQTRQVNAEIPSVSHAFNSHQGAVHKPEIQQRQPNNRTQQSQSTITTGIRRRTDFVEWIAAQIRNMLEGNPWTFGSIKKPHSSPAHPEGSDGR
jgi:hypothetical protein